MDAPPTPGMNPIEPSPLVETSPPVETALADDEASRARGGFALDRPATYRDLADGATDTGLPYWLVLSLAGGIALLGLALNSAAVVIGAMLVAPLLSPVLGLGLALAVGDGRLALETLAAIALSTVAVVALAAVLTVLLPYHDLTPEIAARTRPTLLDLAVAVFSGAAGALVSVARGSRFAGAGAGVAVAVALVPPLAAAGFGVGTGWDGPVVRGALLLYGANLGGIVLSAMTVFLLAGMHRPEVLAVVRGWHRAPRTRGLASWVERQAGSRPAVILRAPLARVALVLAFVALVAFPLAETLRVVVRETRVGRAVDAAAAVFSEPGRSFVLGRQVELLPGQARVHLRVATEAWYGDDAADEFERAATARAGEPVEVVLEQIPASDGDLAAFAEMIRPEGVAGAGGTPNQPGQGAAAGLPDLLRGVRSRVGVVLAGLVMPDSAAVLGHTLAVDDGGSVGLTLRYAAPVALSPDATTMVRRQLTGSLDGVPVSVDFMYAASTRPRALGPSPSDAELASLADVLAAHRMLHLRLVAGPNVRGAPADSVARRLVRLGVASTRVEVRSGVAGGFHAALLPAPVQATPGSGP